MRNTVLRIVLVLTIIGEIVGCKSTETPSLINEPISEDPNAPTPGVINALAGFNVKPKLPKGTNYYIHRDGNFSQSCVVDPASTAQVDRDIMCTLEIEELEGLFHGLEMVLNVPPDMCSYITYKPYYFFGLPWGRGPTQIELQYNADGEYQTGFVTAGSNGGVTPEGEPFCDFNHTSVGANCCIGQVQIIKKVTGQPDSSSFHSWEGKVGNCVAGPGAAAERDELDNLPLADILKADDGASKTFIVENSLKKGVGSIYFANYFDGTLGVDTFPSPFYWDPISPVMRKYRANPYYEWICLNDAMEYRARIRVRVREWNEVEEFLLGALGDPDTTGAETGFTGQPINDLWDWADYLVGAPPDVPADSFPGLAEDN